MTPRDIEVSQQIRRRFLVLDGCEAGDIAHAAFLQQRVLPRLKEIAASGGESAGQA